jgi:hypothetical protein
VPRERKWIFSCPITGAVATEVEGDTLPDRWARIGDDYYSPRGMYVLAHRIIFHPDATYQELLAAPWPSTVFDDWQPLPGAPTPPPT